MICETNRCEATFSLDENVVSFKNASIKRSNLKTVNQDIVSD